MSYPLLHFLNVHALLQEIPGLLEQVDFEPSAVHALAFDPTDQRRLAFQLGAPVLLRLCGASSSSHAVPQRAE